MSKLPEDRRELISACIDAEHELGEDDILRLSEDGELLACWRSFQLVSDALKHNAGSGKVLPVMPANVPESGQSGSHGLSLARAAMYLFVSGVVVFAWLNLVEGDHDSSGKQQIAEATEQGEMRAGSPAVSQEIQGVATPADFRLDYLIYHSSYVANSDSAVMPYVRLADQN